METDLNKLRDRAYLIAKSHGFHEKEESDETHLMLIITEIAEAVNADRKNHHANVKAFEHHIEYAKMHNVYSDDYFKSCFSYIDESVECELSDVAIRLLDFAGARNTDFNIKIDPSFGVNIDSTFCENCFKICRAITNPFFHNIREHIRCLLGDVFIISKMYNIDLFKFIDLKMKYNELKPYKNGKEY